MKRLMVLLSAVAVLPSCVETSVPADNDILAAAVDAPDAVWIDLRTADEYRKGHLPDAINIPLDQLKTSQDLKIALEQAIPDPTAHINLYCRTGKKSTMVDRQMEKYGYAQVVNVGSYGKLKNMR